MTKHFCDACGKEEPRRLYPIEIFVHVKKRELGEVQIIDGKSEPVSGRSEKTELCLSCYNKVAYPLWRSILDISIS
jgi:hypothetical protein